MWSLSLFSSLKAKFWALLRLGLGGWEDLRTLLISALGSSASCWLSLVQAASMAVICSKLGGCLGGNHKIGSFSQNRSLGWGQRFVGKVNDQLRVRFFIRRTLGEPAWGGSGGLSSQEIALFSWEDWGALCLVECLKPCLTDLAWFLDWLAMGRTVTFPQGKVSSSLGRTASFLRRKVSHCLGGTASFPQRMESSGQGRTASFIQGKVSNYQGRTASFPRGKESACLTACWGWIASFPDRKVSNCWGRIASFTGGKVSNCLGRTASFPRRKESTCLTACWGWIASFTERKVSNCWGRIASFTWGKVSNCLGDTVSFPGRKVSSGLGITASFTRGKVSSCLGSTYLTACLG